MPDASDEHELQTLEDQARFDRYIDQRALPAARKAYGDDHSALGRAVYAAVAAGTSLAGVMAIIDMMLGRTAAGVAHAVGTAAQEAHRDAVRGYGAHIAKLDRSDSPLAHPTLVDEAARARAAQIRDRVRAGAASLAAAAAERAKQQLQAQRAAAEHPHGDPSEDARVVEASVAHDAWMVDRMAATEVAAAYNGGQVEAGKLLRKRGADWLFNRWVEHVSDATWNPTDKRTAHDSIYLHAQVAPPGELFSMPDDDPWGEWAGDEWEAPPNRPNDRAILVPWRKAWGSPGWLNVGGRRVWLVRGRGPHGGGRHRGRK